MSVSSFLPHIPEIKDLNVGYIQVVLDPRGPFLGYDRLNEAEHHSCFGSDINLYLQKVMINSTTIIGAGNHYMNGLILSPLPSCTHYKVMVIGVPKQKMQPVQTHDDFIILMILTPISLLYPKVPIIDLELELTALIQQNTDKAPEELADIIIDYIEWKLM